MAFPVRVLHEHEIRSLIGPAEALREVREAFAKLGRGEATLPGVLAMELPDGRGEVHVKGAYLHGSPFYAVKEAASFPSASGQPAASGVVLVFDATTGRLAAVLLDNGFLTDLRTGAAGALAADLLANAAVAQVGILGCGAQARFQLEALLGVRRPQKVVVFGRSEAKAHVYAEEMQARLGIPVDVAGSAYRAVEGSEVLITATSAREPLVREDWVFRGTHITAVGADAPEKHEVFARVLAKADKVVADRREQCLRIGEIHHAVESGFLRPEEVYAELGELAAGLKPGREREDEITVADLTGVGIEDAAVAAFVLAEAIRLDKGRLLES